MACLADTIAISRQSFRGHRGQDSQMSARQHIVTDDSLERCLDWLRDNAPVIGAAKTRLVLAEHMVKHIRALEMKKWAELGVGAQEREALASQAYLDAITEEAQAAGAFEEMRSRREAAALKIEAWRSEQANYRAMKI